MRVEFKELAELQALTEQERTHLEKLFQTAYQLETELVKAFYQHPTVQHYLKTVEAVKQNPKQPDYVLNQTVHQQYQNLVIQEYFKSLERKNYLHDRIKLCRLVNEEQQSTGTKSMKLKPNQPKKLRLVKTEILS